MLGKLIKHEFRATGRLMAPLFGALLLLAVFSRVANQILQQVPNPTRVLYIVSVLLAIVYVLAGLGVMVFSTVLMIKRFHQNFLTDEGYLMFTLPVSVSEHIGSKLLTSMIFQIGSFAVAVLSGGLLFAVLTPPNFSDVAQAFQEAGRYLRVNPLPAGTGWVVAEFIVYTLIAAAVSILQIYTAISIGHLAKKNRGWFALLAYVGISIAFSIIMNGCMSLLQSDAFPNVLLNWEFCLDDTGWHVQGVGMMASTIGIGIGLELLKGTGFFFATRAILSKRLNLE